MRFSAIAIIEGILIVASPTASRAQTAPAPAPATPAVASAPAARCATLPPVEQEMDTVFATLSTDPAGALPASWEGMLLEGLAEQFHAPASLRVPIVGGTRHHGGGSGMVTTVIDGQVVATLHRTGRIDHALLAESTLSPEFDRQILAAVSSLDSAMVLPPFPDEVKAKSVRIRFTVTQTPDNFVRSRPLLVSQQPAWTLDSIASRRRPYLALHYSSELQYLNVGDTVIVTIALDTTGLPIVGTARFIRASHRLFEEAILGALPAARFDALHISGCPVPYRQKFIFYFAHGPLPITPDWYRNW